MSKFIDLFGKRFGYLLVLSRDNSKKRSRVHWLCSCSCGLNCVVSGDKLVSGRQISCGCKQFDGFFIHNKKKSKTAYTIRRKNFLTSHYKQGAKLRNLEFALSKEEVDKLSYSNCHYCNDSPKNATFSNDKKYKYIYQGIDRVNSKFGYTSNNVLPCCKTCNFAKGDMEYPAFIMWIDRLVQYSKRNVRIIFNNFSNYEYDEG